MCATSNTKFSPPTNKQRAKALGDTNNLNDDIRRAVTIDVNECFLPFPTPKANDWVSVHSEPGQTVEEFERVKTIISKERIIRIQPIGSFDHPRSPSLETICEFSRHFFPGCQFDILPAIDFDGFSTHNPFKKRINSYTQQPQYDANFIIDHLKKMRRKRHEKLFWIGVTMADIYPEPKWNFVFGLASEEDGIGVYSFARLDPAFPQALTAGPCTEDERILMLKRSIGVFVHEIIHLFGVEHCIYYLCLMNGAETQEEMDEQPLYLCPICLRKMYSSFETKSSKYNVKEMYEAILDQCKKLNFKDEAEWYENRLKIFDINTE